MCWCIISHGQIHVSCLLLSSSTHAYPTHHPDYFCDRPAVTVASPSMPQRSSSQAPYSGACCGQPSKVWSRNTHRPKPPKKNLWIITTYKWPVHESYMQDWGVKTLIISPPQHGQGRPQCDKHVFMTDSATCLASHTITIYSLHLPMLPAFTSWLPLYMCNT